MRLFLLAVFLALLGLAQAQESAAPAAAADVILMLEHSFGDDVYSLRSNVTLATKIDGKQTITFSNKNGIFGEQIQHFKKIVSSNSLYKLRITVVADGFISKPVVSALPSCELIKSGFKEELSIFLTANKQIMGASYTIPNVPLARPCSVDNVPSAVSFQTRLRAGETSVAQQIPLQAEGPRPAHLQNMKLGTADDKTMGQQNQSFFQRYWYIFLIFALYMFMGGGGGGGGGEGNGKGGEGAPAAAPGK